MPNNDIRGIKNKKGEGDQSPKQGIERFHQRAQQDIEAHHLSQQSPQNSEQKTPNEVIQDFEAALKRYAALKQQNADRLLAQQLEFTDQELAKSVEPSASNFRKSDLIKEQEFWMRDPSKKNNDIIVNMYQEQQELSEWHQWLKDPNSQGQWALWFKKNFQKADDAYTYAFQNGLLGECNQERHQHQEWSQQQAAYQEWSQQQAAYQEQPQQSYYPSTYSGTNTSIPQKRRYQEPGSETDNKHTQKRASLSASSSKRTEHPNLEMTRENDMPHDNTKMIQNPPEAQQPNEFRSQQAQDAIEYLRRKISINDSNFKNSRGKLFSAKKIEEINNVVDKLREYKSALPKGDANKADTIYDEIKKLAAKAKEATDIISIAITNIEKPLTKEQQIQDAIEYLKHRISSNEYKFRNNKQELFSAKKIEEINNVVDKLREYKSALPKGDANKADTIYSEIKNYINNNIEETADIMNTALTNLGLSIERRPTETQQPNEFRAQQAQKAIKHLMDAIRINKSKSNKEKGQLFSSSKTTEINDIVDKLHEYKSVLSKGDANKADTIYDEIKKLAAKAKEAKNIINTALTNIESPPTEEQQAQNAIDQITHAIRANKSKSNKGKCQPFSSSKTTEINNIINKLDEYKSALSKGNANKADTIYDEIKKLAAKAKEAKNIINTALTNIERHHKQQ